MTILDQIEQKRNELLMTAQNNGLTSKDTLLCSEELDKLINACQLEKQESNK